jgi:hypothetical protein
MLPTRAVLVHQPQEYVFGHFQSNSRARVTATSSTACSSVAGVSHLDESRASGIYRRAQTSPGFEYDGPCE